MPNKDTTYIIRTTQPPIFKRAMKHRLGLETKKEIIWYLTKHVEAECRMEIDKHLGKEH